MWRREGGFAARPNEVAADLASTYYAARLILITGDHSFLAEITTSLVNWLQRQLKKEENQTVDSLYYLMRTVDLLNLHVGGNLVEECLEFLQSCGSPTGGFGNVSHTSGDIEHSYCVVHLLLAFGKSTPDSLSGWLARCVQPDGWIAWSPTDPRYTHATLYWGSHLALLLNIPLPWASIWSLIKRTQNPDGGFGFNSSSLWHTYCAVSTRIIAEIALGHSRTGLIIE